MSNYTAIIKQDGNFWIGWIQEIPGVNCQENSKNELIDSLKITLNEAIEFNKAEALAAIGEGYKEEILYI